MALFDMFKKKEVITTFPETEFALYAPRDIKSITEQFKGEIDRKEIKFPKALGEEHVIDKFMCEKLFRTYGLVSCAVNKIANSIIAGGIYTTSDNERAKQIIDSFMEDVDFLNLLKDGIKEGLSKGDGYLEMGGDKNKPPEGLKVLDSKYMYVTRDNFGVVEKYTQYFGNLRGFSLRTKNKTDFEPFEILHIPFNKIGDDAYGTGIIAPALTTLDNLMSMEIDMHVLMKRKANTPVHVKMGNIAEKRFPKQSDVDAFGLKMENMRNKQEYVTDPFVEMNVLNFGNIGEKFTAPLEHDMDNISYAFRIPLVMFGKSNVPEGLARVQMEDYERMINGYQEAIEKPIEQILFKRVLNANGINDHVELHWGQPSTLEKNEKIGRITEIMKLPSISFKFIDMLERDLAGLLGYDVKELETPEEEKKKELRRQQPLLPAGNRQSIEDDKITINSFNWVLEQNSMVLQTLVLSKDIFKSVKDAKKWINDHNFKSGNVDETDDSYRFRQRSPDEFKLNSFRTINISRGVKGVVGKLKGKESINVNEFIKKNTKGEWCVYSHQTGKNFGCYKSKKEAEDRLKQIKRFSKDENCSCPTCEVTESVDKEYGMDMTISEWLNFNFREYLMFILATVESDPFNNLMATTSAELAMGKFSSIKVNRLKNVLEDGFRRGITLRELSNNVLNKVRPGSLYRVDEKGNILRRDGKRVVRFNALSRSMNIARTETSRTASLGVLDYYKSKGIERVSWVASVGMRTCDYCNSMNGKILSVDEARNLLPAHSGCRCTYVQLSEE